jgi:hypothetical protein
MYRTMKIESKSLSSFETILPLSQRGNFVTEQQKAAFPDDVNACLFRSESLCTAFSTRKRLAPSRGK